MHTKIGKIYNRINKSNTKRTEESTEKFLIGKTTRRLLEIEFEENHSRKSKCLKFIVKKILPLV